MLITNHFWCMALRYCIQIDNSKTFLLTDIVSKSTVLRTLKCISFKYPKLPHTFQLTCTCFLEFIKDRTSWNQAVVSNKNILQ